MLKRTSWTEKISTEWWSSGTKLFPNCSCWYGNIIFFLINHMYNFCFHFHSLVLVFGLKQVRFCLLFVLVYLNRSRWSLISRLAGFVDDMTWNVKRSYCCICCFSVCEKKNNQCTENNEVWYMGCLASCRQSMIKWTGGLKEKPPGIEESIPIHISYSM